MSAGVIERGDAPVARAASPLWKWAFIATLATLGAGGYELRCEKVLRAGIAATKFSVNLSGDQPGRRNLDDILAMIDAADLPGQATKLKAASHGNCLPVELRKSSSTNS